MITQTSKIFDNGRQKVRSIPMASPDLSEVEISAVNQVLTTSHLSIGPQLEAFERACAAYVGTAHAVAVNSGTSGLHLCMIAAGVNQGDLVITSPFSFVASANCVLYERAIPVFIDVDPTTGNIDPGLVAEAVEALTNERQSAFRGRWLPPVLRNSSYYRKATSRLKAILPIHVFGQPVDMDPLLKIAQSHRLCVIEDACEAIGAEYKERNAGTLGDAAVFAFYPNKQMTTGEGGMIVTNNQAWAHLFDSLRNQGRDIFDSWLNHSRLGYNYRLDELSAALGIAQLGRIEELLAKRAQVAEWYNERLKDLEDLSIPFIASTTTRMSWFVYVIRLANETQRNTVMDKLAARNIPSRPYFSPIHLQPFYAKPFGYQPGDFPITERLGKTSLALPFSSVMTEDQVDYVCSHLVEIVQSGSSTLVREHLL